MHSHCVSGKYAIGVPKLPIAAEIDNCPICLEAKLHEANKFTFLPTRLMCFTILPAPQHDHS
jgi:hypothetical protein